MALRGVPEQEFGDTPSSPMGGSGGGAAAQHAARGAVQYSQGKNFFNRAPWRHQSNFQGGLKPPGSLLDPFCRVNLMLVISEQVKQLRRQWLRTVRLLSPLVSSGY